MPTAIDLTDLPSFQNDPNAALAWYNELGFHIERGVWSHAECQAFITASESLPSVQNGTFAPAMHPHRENPTFLDALCSPRIVSIMERLVGGRVSGLQTEFFFCPPGTPGFALHQDNYYVEAPYGAFASAWIALQDTTPDMGGLVVYPYTHRLPMLPVEDIVSTASKSQDINANRQQAVVPDGYEALPVTVTEGSVIFLHGNNVHSSFNNTSSKFRRALLMTYLRKGETFRPGMNARRAEVNVYSELRAA